MSEKELVKVRDAWQKYYEEELTLDDARQISQRLNVFFQLLAEGKARLEAKCQSV